METIENTGKTLQGGEFLLKTSRIDEIFIPEERSEEQQLIFDMARDFVQTEVFPVMERIERQESGLCVALMERAGALGILGASVPEEYGGFGKDYVTTTFLTEGYGCAGSLAVSLAAHTGIGTMPIVYYGTPEQKSKYLPKLASGEWKAAYCLTEPGSGSDARGARSTAHLSADGSVYLLNGEKMWITNGGFADVFIVFAKVNGTDFSAFIVDGTLPGITRGPEEKKMGIKGSSTCMIFFQDVPVPAENVLGTIGKGHLIAFNVLNIGRHRLATAALAAAKLLSEISVQYANQRHQFNQPIGQFGAIQHKLAEQAIRIWVNESAIYRCAFDIERQKQQQLALGLPYSEALMKAAEEYAIECALLKVTASEMLDYVVDECVQIHGGMGYSEEAIPARAYRDARINRIFEGTNEINRLLAIDMLIRRAMKGRIELMSALSALQQEILDIPMPTNTTNEGWTLLQQQLANMKKIFLLVAGSAAQKLMAQLEQEQEIVMLAADIMADIYLCESALLRLMKREQLGLETTVQEDIVQIAFHDAMGRIQLSAQNALEAFASGDDLKMLQLALRRFAKTESFNCKNARRRIAHRLLSDNRYCF